MEERRLTHMTKLGYEKPELVKHAQLKEVTLSSTGSGNGNSNGNSNGKGNGN